MVRVYRSHPFKGLLRRLIGVMSFFEEVAIDDSLLKVKDRQTPFFVMIDVNKKIIKNTIVLFRF